MKKERNENEGRIAFGRRILFAQPPKDGDDGRAWKKIRLPGGKFKIVRK